MRKSLGHPFGAGALLVAVTLLAYFPALRAGFIWDDDSTLTANPLIKAADGLGRIWATTQARDYWPVTYSALWVEWRWWGMAPLGYHAVNLALHLGAAFLFWAILQRLGVTGAPLAAFIFAVHPVNVESVAWITQQKNLWAMVFFLVSIWWFLASQTPVRRSLSEGGPTYAHGKYYWLSLLAFTLAMLSKGSVAMLPFVLLGLIAWNRSITKGDLVRTAPFFLVGAGLAAVNVWFAHHTSVEPIRTAGILERLLGAATVVWFYLGKALWPAHLVFVYPAWDLQAAAFRWWIPLLGIAGVTVVLARYRTALFCWVYFCLMLVPVMGLTDVYFMKYSLVADHCEYLAIIGVIGFAAAGGERLGSAATSPRFVNTWRAGKLAVAGVVIGLLAVLTWRQGQMYRDVRTLYVTTLKDNPASWVIHFNLGEILLEEGRISEAMAHFEDALRIKPEYMEAHNNLGIAMAESNQLPPAIGQFEEAVRIKPDYAPAHVNLGNALIQTGRVRDAIGQFEQAVRINPDYAEAHQGLGLALGAEGLTEEARAQLAVAVRLKAHQ